MSGSIRLSEASEQVTRALSLLDDEALRELTLRLNDVAAGRVPIEPEPVDAVQRELRILEEVLRATEENINVLERLHARKAGNEWVL